MGLPDTLVFFICIVAVCFIGFFFYHVKKNKSKKIETNTGKKYFYHNKISRKKYFFSFVLFLILYVCSLFAVDAASFFINTMLSILLYVFFIHITIGRLNDINVSRWFSLALLLPIVNLIFIIVLIFIKSSKK